MPRDIFKREETLEKQEQQAISTPDHGNDSELSKLPNKRKAPESSDSKVKAMSLDDLLKPVPRAEDR